MSEAKSNLVPQFLKAPTPEKLQELMLENNLRLKQYINYQDIQQAKSGEWFAWYYLEINFYSRITKNNKVIDK